MPKIQISTATADRLHLLASAWETDEDGAIGRLMDRLAASVPSGSRESVHRQTDNLGVHALYEGLRVTGVYHRDTHSITITSGPLDGQSFKSPSGAAIAVIQAINPKVNPNRNGWSFWTVTDTGSTLQSVRHD